jgi:hypothetical protein
MTKEKTNEPASDVINITKIPEPMSHEDLFKLELPKDDVRLTSSDSLAITEIDNRLTADARSKFFKLRKIAEGIEGLQEKWHFWNNAKREYKNSIDLSMSYQSASGVCSMSDPGKGKWLDALIDNELAYYREQMRVDKESNAGSEQPVNLEDTMKVIYLYQTGVLRFLATRMGTWSNSKLGRIVAMIIGATDSSAISALRRLPTKTGDLKEQMIQENHDMVVRHIHHLKVNVKPMSEIKFHDDGLE